MKRVAAVLMLVASMAVVSQSKAADPVVKSGSHVAFDFTLTVDGKVVDSSQGKAPLEFTQGEGKMLPGLTKQMEGMKVGEERDIQVNPQDAYGNPDPAAIKEVPASSLPPGMKPAVGMILEAKDPNGRSFPVRIAEVKGDTVMMDFNHPLAGKTLLFKVKVVSIK